MRGTVLEFDLQSSSGLISGEDGHRYPFHGTDVKSDFKALRLGVEVDFETEGATATSIYIISRPRARGSLSSGLDSLSSGQQGPKSKIVAGLLAIFLGQMGIHKFYLGYNLPGLILLLVALFGHLGLFIPNVIALIVSVVEGVIYLTKSDEDFDATYVSGTKHWF